MNTRDHNVSSMEVDSANAEGKTDSRNSNAKATSYLLNLLQRVWVWFCSEDVLIRCYQILLVIVLMWSLVHIVDT